MTTTRHGVPRVEADAVSYRYPDGTTALQEVSVRVAPGEIVAVLGRSGAGKSTLMRCLAGLAAPTSGRVLHDGVDRGGLRGRAKRRAHERVGLVFQEFQLVERATVLSNTLIGRLACQPLLPSLVHFVRRTDREIAVEAVRRLGLEDQFRKRADALSGGQRQRVAIARALAQQPDMLLADEPVANLDPVLARGVVDDIVRLARIEGLTAVLNLHDVDLARDVADRLVGLRAGRLVFDCPTASVTTADLDLLYAEPDRALAGVR
ncbi:phosphonate ABC transporter ATP-binding protein [Rhodococcus sp. IEGM 1305]|uniref:phosphonate ABC transporter ATP-binding protein n=1 Tax=Rhodococcus sp. IEGM 1305 TaxID=3047092 RepID=UPI0024B6B491|nr:phosphonate ABC transporter ATP-binding protein [Rhodococcus sp. IEGM 1305]MDI9947737.1 phosphonate ABC transporter ATP-binding protein [Rhodococcus sp. IEGM 1305]